MKKEKMMLVDVSLNGPPHNFIVTDKDAKSFMVSQNSHSISYAILCYYTSYIKTYWPHIFIATSMIDALESKSSGDLDDVLRDFIKECEQLGIKLLPPMINISSITFTPHEDDKNGRYITFGLTSVRKVGPTVATAIIEERNTNGPYKSIQDIVTRGVARKDSMINLIKIGAFDNIPVLNDSDVVLNRRALLQAYEVIHKWESKNKTRLKNAKEESRAPLPLEINIEELLQLPEFSAVDLSNMEFEIFGVYISSRLLDSYKIPKNAYSTTDAKRNGIVNGSYAGIILSRRSFVSKTGTPYVMFEISDGITNLPCVYFYSEDSIEEVERLGLITNNNAICVNGSMTERGSVVVKKITKLKEA